MMRTWQTLQKTKELQAIRLLVMSISPLTGSASFCLQKGEISALVIWKLVNRLLSLFISTDVGNKTEKCNCMITCTGTCRGED